MNIYSLKDGVVHSSKMALICGVSGQDGAFLAEFLLKKGYVVFGTSRDAKSGFFRNLETLGIQKQVELMSMAVTDFRSVLQVLTNVEPDEVYNLAGQTSVGFSFDQPVETLESISLGTLNLLEAIRFIGRPIRFYNAGSSECFGDTGGVPANETTPFYPRSPYAVAKSAAHWQVANYREAYKLFACTGILFNHESHLRHDRFVTRKIVKNACRIAGGDKEPLFLGNISIARDWGLASEYVDAMWRMLQQDIPSDYVIATGECNTLQSFVQETFAHFNLNWQDHVVTDHTLIRPSEIMLSNASPEKAYEELGWRAFSKMRDVVKFMVEKEIELHGF